MGIDGQYRALVGLVLTLLAAPAARACDLALVLAVDVSLSVDAEEYALQMLGTAQALRSDAVAGALLAGTGTALAVFQWSGRDHQSMVLPWTMLDTSDAVDAAAARIAAAPRIFQSDTAPGSAIAYAAGLHRTNPYACDRMAIDVSGDGIENGGQRTRSAAAAAIQDGITINGLVILGQDDRTEPFYRHNVIGGPGAFVEIANGYGDYPRAIQEKLLKELPQMLAQGDP